MNDIIRYELPKYLDYIDLLNLSLTCQANHNLLQDIVLKRKKKKEDEIEELFNFSILDIVGKDNLMKAPYVPWNTKWESLFLSFNELDNFNEPNAFRGSIAYTKDENNRSFIFVKIKVEDPIWYTLKTPKYTILVIYQKYSDLSLYFVSDPSNLCFTDKGFFLDKECHTHFKNFFQSGIFSYSNFPYEFNFLPLYEKIYIFKEKENI